MIRLLPTCLDLIKVQLLVGEIRWAKNLVILCKEKSRTIVEYTLHDARKPIGAATNRTVKRLPKELKGPFPEPEQIIKLLEEVLA